MTSSERQRVERERNRRARESVAAISTLAFNAYHWEEKRELTYTEITNALYLLGKWAEEGDRAVNEWRLTLPPDRRAFVASAFDRMNIQLPFCCDCGAELRRNMEGVQESCQCALPLEA
jgi:hypothetical protein